MGAGAAVVVDRVVAGAGTGASVCEKVAAELKVHAELEADAVDDCVVSEENEVEVDELLTATGAGCSGAGCSEATNGAGAGAGACELVGAGAGIF